MSKKRDRVFDIENLDKWEKWLKSLSEEPLERLQDRVLRSAGLRLLELTDDNTPVRTTRLKSSLQMQDKDNIFKVQVGKRAYVVVGTAVEYAEYVEKGFSQEDRKGKFVPGYWKSGTFHYDPEADTGMVLTGAVIEGAHMFEKALDNLDPDMDKIAEFEFRRLYAELFRG